MDAVVGGRVQGETAPAGADLDHMLTLPQPELAADRVELGERGLLERGLPIGEDAAGIGHGRVEHELVQRVAEVVVRGDVARAALAAVAVEPVEDLVQRPAEPRPAAVHAVHQPAVGDEDAYEAREVVAAP